MKNSLILGASGFIGQHLANYINTWVNCFDIEIEDGISEYCDVRNPIEIEANEDTIIYNLAAIHTTPGHAYHEYFETNIQGAENVCNFARKKNINIIVTNVFYLFKPFFVLK